MSDGSSRSPGGGADRAPGRTLLRRAATGLWACLPALTAGVATPFFFIHAAFRRRSVWTLIPAVVFPLLVVGIFVLNSASTWWEVCVAVNWIAGGGLALGMRGYVFAPAPGADGTGRALEDRETKPLPPLLAEAERRRAARAQARGLMERDPLIARELGVGRPDLSREFDDGGLVDVNNAPDEALGRITGITAEHAAALALARSRGGPFTSVEDAVIRADLPPHLQEVLAEYAVFG
ncbi:hypothetical protein [Marinactinospora rubrisoli]|uniref:Helix-hairpin-helix domain-containing protein n=1 Tax=Marinactinospora rubrisoli TaxID=2715399 RepID=A0ABW2KH81_9ACTN